MHANKDKFACKKEVVNYICPYCKKEHSTPRGMANCILQCEVKLKEAEEKKRKDELEKQKETRRNAIVEQWDKIDEERKKTIEMENEYYKDYGEKVFYRIPEFGPVYIKQPISVKDFSDEITKMLRTRTTTLSGF